MAQLSLEHITKEFPDGTSAVKDVSITVDDKEFLVLVGPSGCGKSTTLRMIAGLDAPQSGEIKIAGTVVNNCPPKDRNIAMVFQNYALYPHMTVYRNLSFGLLLRYGGGVLNRGLIRIFQPRKAARLRELRSGIDHQVRHAAERLGILNLLDRKPHQLSGGERQRVALGRAIVRDPAVFLFDEPLSNLDAKLRQAMRRELKRLHRELKATIVYVTHDQVEAMTMGDRIAVMKDGEILQTGTPTEVYRYPANTFVAQFIGPVPMNLICSEAINRLDTNERDDLENSGTLIGFRAEDARITERVVEDKTDRDEITIPATVESLDHLGDSTMLGLRLTRVGLNKGVASQTRSDDAAEDCINSKTTQAREVSVGQLSNGFKSIAVRETANCLITIGQQVIVHVDRDRISRFDPATGNNLDRGNS